MRYYEAGEVVSVPVLYRDMVQVQHHGVVVQSGWDDARVVSNSKRRGGVVEEWLHEFSAGAQVQVHPELRGELSTHEVIRRARSRIGEAYDVAANNCEHFVRGVQGLVRRSPQLAAGLVAGGATLAFLGLLGWWISGGRK